VPPSHAYTPPPAPGGEVPRAPPPPASRAPPASPFSLTTQLPLTPTLSP
jgi:hypothetical protein